MNTADKVGVCIAEYGNIGITDPNNTDRERQNVILNAAIFSRAIYLTIKDNSNMGEEVYSAIYNCLLKVYLKACPNGYTFTYIPNVEYDGINFLVFLRLCYLVFTLKRDDILNLECFVTACYYDSEGQAEQMSVEEAEWIEGQLEQCNIVNLYRTNFEYDIKGRAWIDRYWSKTKRHLQDRFRTSGFEQFHNE